MGFVAVIVAAVAAFAIGAVWYGVLSKPWIEASGVPVNEKGQPQNSGTPAPYALSFLCIILVAGMMRHTFALSGIDTLGKGLVAGLGIGLFFITPWITLNTPYSMRPMRLSAIDGGYATLGCGVMGLVLMLF